MEELNYKHVETLKKSSFNPKLPTKIVIHGYTDSIAKGKWMGQMRDAFHKTGEYNVFLFDWSKAADGPVYDQATSNTRIAGAELAKIIDALHNSTGMAYKDVHLIAHSMGSHTAGHAGRMTKQKIGRITGMDPAGPRFANYDPAVHLDPTDADFVDVIHTNGAPLIKGGIGTDKSCGHVDFWVNDGKRQPGCPALVSGITKELGKLATGAVTDFLHPIGCNHVRSFEIFIRSISEPCQYPAVPCPSDEDYQNGKCTSCGEVGCNYIGLAASPISGGGDHRLVNRENTVCDAAYNVNLQFCQRYRNFDGHITITFQGSNGKTTHATFHVSAGLVGLSGTSRTLAFSAKVGKATRVTSVTFKARGVISKLKRLRFKSVTIQYIPGGDQVTLDMPSKCPRLGLLG